MKRCLAVALALGVLGAPAAGAAQDTEWNRYTLADLDGVYVHFEISSGCDAVGVTATAYEADVSLKLIESDVGVLTQAEMLAHPALPELRVAIDCAEGTNGTSGSMAYSVTLRVQQSAQMVRDTQITLPEAVTWFATKIGVATGGGAADAVGAALTDEIDEFVAAWTAVHADEGEGGDRRRGE